MKIGIVMTIKDRPELTKQSLEDLAVSLRGVSGVTIVLVDDGSRTSPMNVGKELFGKKKDIFVIYHEKPLGVKTSLIEGVKFCFDYGCDIVTNLDNDVRLKEDWLFELLRLQRTYEDYIITGFHSTTKNKDGSERHKIIRSWGRFCMKESVGGINMMFNKEVYEKYILPALSTAEGNWDYLACRNSMLDNHPIITSIPSVIQHTGIYQSSMGHDQEFPDVADDWPKLKLPNVTLFGLDDRNDGRLDFAAKVSQLELEFGQVIMSDNPVDGKEGYSDFMINYLHRLINTSHVLVIQADGYVVNPKAWDDSWLQYDYIGATWMFKDGMNVGNGGFSLRSKRLCELTSYFTHDYPTHPEDYYICRTLRPYLEKNGIKFAPEEVANKFSIEAYGTGNLFGANKYSGQFGFHGYNVDWTGWNGHVPKKPESNKPKRQFKNIVDGFM